MARKNPVEAAVGVACGNLKRLIKVQSDRIVVDTRTLRAKRALLKKLEGQPKPDVAQIKALRKSIAALESQLEEDQASLRELKDVFAENCSGQ
jgi:hypothetical protein